MDKWAFAQAASELALAVKRHLSGVGSHDELKTALESYWQTIPMGQSPASFVP